MVRVFCLLLAALSLSACVSGEVPGSSDTPQTEVSQPSATQVALAPGTYFVTYHVSAVLEAAGYLQITPFYNGAAFLEYGVYDRVSSASVSVSGSAAFIAVVPAQTVLTLNCNSSAAVRDGAMTMVIMGLHTEESGA